LKFFNTRWKTGSIPDEWKGAVISPLFKYLKKATKQNALTIAVSAEFLEQNICKNNIKQGSQNRRKYLKGRTKWLQEGPFLYKLCFYNNPIKKKRMNLTFPHTLPS
jgi:stalled ribosome alternative rescue factor ArfA